MVKTLARVTARLATQLLTATQKPKAHEKHRQARLEKPGGLAKARIAGSVLRFFP